MNYQLKKLQKRLSLFKEIDLYTVTCEELSNGRTNYEVLDAVIKGGGKIIQLRDKKRDKDNFLKMAKKFRKITANAGILLIINDYIDVAIDVDADGVHLGQEDIKKYSVRFVRELLGEDKIIGVSTHSVKEFETFQKEDVDYLAFGPIFETKTKNYCIGTEKIESIVKKAIKPVVFIGGINLENINQVIEKGGKTIGVIREIVGANNIEEATRKMKKIINQLSSRA